MTLDFDPMKVPQQFADWLTRQSTGDQERHAGVFAKRAVAALHVLKALAELRAALAKVDDSRLRESIRDLIELARDLHDYDPTSD